MPYFSKPLPESLVRQSGSHTKFPTVMHQNHQICTVAAEGIQDEFNQAMDTNIITDTVAPVPQLGRMHAVAFTIPNCLPERLTALTRFAEFTILNDDFYDIAKNEEINKINADIQSVLNGEAEARASETSISKSKQFQASLLLEMVNIDSDLAMDIMTTYSKGLELATFPPDTLRTLDDYLPVRMINSGLDVFQTMSCFGMGIKLTPEEKAQLNDFVDTAMFSTTLINDFHSWPKEVKHHIEHPGSEYPFNAVAILMRHSGLSEAGAMRALRERQAELQERHLAMLRALEAAGPLPEAHMLYILAAQYAASGSEFWSVHVPRYPSKEDLDQPEVEFVNGMFRYKTCAPAVRPPPAVVVNGTYASVVGGGLSKRQSMPKLSNGATNGHAKMNGHAGGLKKPAVAKKQKSMPRLTNGHAQTNGHSNGVGNGYSKVNGTQNGHANGAVNGYPKTNGVQNGHTNGVNGHLTNGIDATNGHTNVVNGASNGTVNGNHSTLPQKFRAKCTDEFVIAPYKYLTSMPSKGIRDLFITALNWWLEAPDDEILAIKDIVSYLHQSSLMLDDIEDDSKLRRGQPSTHMIYGVGQTINSANYIFVQAFARVQKLGRANSEVIDMFIEEVESLHKGQSYDLFWKDQVHCPSVDEYMMMIDNKTGGLFRLCVRLMEAVATRKFDGISSEVFVTQLSRYFQIRDDYQNLMSDQYAKEKGYAEDLDEGKISLPLIYTLQSSPQRNAIMRVFKRRDPASEGLGLEMKTFIVNEMRRTGALDKTYDLLISMQDDLMVELRRLEREFGAPNASLELVLRKLWLN